ncbi:DUF551 domain-containing protein [Providencia rettgeri]
MQGTNWVKCSDKMPELGKPLLIIASGNLSMEQES